MSMSPVFAGQSVNFTSRCLYIFLTVVTLMLLLVEGLDVTDPDSLVSYDQKDLSMLVSSTSLNDAGEKVVREGQAEETIQPTNTEVIDGNHHSYPVIQPGMKLSPDPDAFETNPTLLRRILALDRYLESQMNE